MFVEGGLFLRDRTAIKSRAVAAILSSLDLIDLPADRALDGDPPQNSLAAVKPHANPEHQAQFRSGRA
jgi:hypothetical protein